MKGLLVALSLSAIIALASLADAIAEDQIDERLQSVRQQDWNVEVVNDQLNYPWDIEATDDQLIITEAAGNIVMLHQGQLQRYTVKTSNPIINEGGGGLMGMALAKDFTHNGNAWLYHTYLSNSGLTNKIIQVHFDGKQWQETKVILSGIPGHHLYNGGRIAIGPDGYLYATTGWTENEDRPQDMQCLAGKVLRMTLDGQVPQDNPITGSLVYSRGHRNPQGLAWNQRGELFATEHSQIAHDEVNIITPSSNYGWPIIQGDEKRAGMKTAWLNSGSRTWAPSGATFAGDNLLVATLGAKGLYMFDKKQQNLRQIFSSGDRLRDVLATGNAIYVITTNRSPRSEGPSADKLLKLTLR
ncbi:sorbosone dehydrogenase family protein [Salmonella enterica]|nr:sorbosone dehydrogenase family protein [Salmonella enterica]EAQ4496624.1 sorbosone dehydrogenase family protein [Salmonella enterica]EBP9159405.1 sorbosone dehydrogenase family protein [Salmonella enterica]EEA1191517.1 sorbosone dehydrogenase family protein [Salmonella enterica]EGA4726463.1 sorbosone dehydrogenase family protein [Salmonella enterica]